MARPTLDRNVKYKTLIKRLNLPKPYVRGLLETLWDVANESGNPVLGSPDDVETAAEWPGERFQLFEALREGRWIETDETDDETATWKIHDYFDHCPEYVHRRSEYETERKVVKTCENCNCEYRSSRKSSKFCSDNCRLSNHRKSKFETDGNASSTERNVSRNALKRQETIGNGTPSPARAPAPAPKEIHQSAAPPVSPEDEEDEPTAGKDQMRPVRNGNGRHKPSGPHVTIAEGFKARWDAKHSPARYTLRKVDFIKAVELIKAVGGCLEDAESAIRRYIESDDEFYRGHALSTLTAAGVLPRFLVDAKPKSVNGMSPENAASIQRLKQSMGVA
jgi:hypothetical protein